MEGSNLLKESKHTPQALRCNHRDRKGPSEACTHDVHAGSAFPLWPFPMTSRKCEFAGCFSPGTDVDSVVRDRMLERTTFRTGCNIKWAVVIGFVALCVLLAAAASRAIASEFCPVELVDPRPSSSSQESAVWYYNLTALGPRVVEGTSSQIRTPAGSCGTKSRLD
jgi:hypothetical protein